MPYNGLIDRGDAASLIPEDVSKEIIKNVADTAWLLRLARRLPNMNRAQTRMPVANALAQAYFVTGDTGLKQTTELDWANRFIDAEEIAAIVPIPEAVLDDTDYDIWGEVKPELERAFQALINGAVLFGTSIPATWTTNMGAAGIVAGSTAAGNTISLANYTDLYEAVLGETAAGVAGLLMLLEADGFDASGHAASIAMKGRYRNVRDAGGQPIFLRSMQDRGQYEVDGAPIYFPKDGSWQVAQALQISGDWQQLVYAVRQDMTYKILTEAVITDAGGNIVYNLAQQDMVALRAVMRIGFALPNPINRMNTNAATRFPFAVLTA